ncbi:MAG: hypothetical protein ACI9W2_000686 [Gammaproteobacteria bacterium]|jgi:hypothetical protein
MTAISDAMDSAPALTPNAHGQLQAGHHARNKHERGFQ